MRRMLIAALTKHLSKYDKWRVTTYGDNPWAPDALLNVIAYQEFYERVIAIIDGKLDSCYRSMRVNNLAGGVSNSQHLEGLAIDVVPSKQFNPDSAARLLFDRAATGDFGPLRQIIIEPSWIHVGYHPNFLLGGLELRRKMVKKHLWDSAYPLIAKKTKEELNVR